MKILLTIIIVTAIAGAQSSASVGHFKGAVIDEKGTPVKGAKILVEGSNLKRTLRSDRLGQFEVDLAPGTYRITIRKSGFADYQLTDLDIELDRSREFAFRLELRNPQS